MEAIVHFIMSHGTMVITSLLGGVIFAVFGLLIMSFHNPKQAIAKELGSIDRLEGVLRQMLTDQNFSKDSGASQEDIDQMSLLKEQLNILEQEVKNKNQQLQQSSESGSSGEETVLTVKIKDLEAKLAEYSIIEEDISDLSRYRQENEQLKSRINEVIGIPAEEVLAMPWDEFEKIVKLKKSMASKNDAKATVKATENGTDKNSDRTTDKSNDKPTDRPSVSTSES